MSELVVDGGQRCAWPEVMMADEYFIPFTPEWGRSNKVLTGGDIVPVPFSATSGTLWPPSMNGSHALWPVGIDPDEGDITFDFSRYAGVRLIYNKGSWMTGYPGTSIDGGPVVEVDPGLTWSGSELRVVDIPAAAGSSEVTFSAPTSGNGVFMQGVFVSRKTDPQLSVLNLSRTGFTSGDWNWCIRLPGTEDMGAGLVAGYDPDLVGIGSWANDFHEGVNKTTLFSRLDGLVAKVNAIAPNADVFTWTNPPIVGESSGWTNFQQWIRDWADDRDVMLIDWHANIPAAGTADLFYASDGTHPRVPLSQYIADFTRCALLPHCC